MRSIDILLKGLAVGVGVDPGKSLVSQGVILRSDHQRDDVSRGGFVDLTSYTWIPVVKGHPDWVTIDDNVDGAFGRTPRYLSSVHLAISAPSLAFVGTTREAMTASRKKGSYWFSEKLNSTYSWKKGFIVKSGRVGKPLDYEIAPCVYFRSYNGKNSSSVPVALRDGVSYYSIKNGLDFVSNMLDSRVVLDGNMCSHMFLGFLRSDVYERMGFEDIRNYQERG